MCQLMKRIKALIKAKCYENLPVRSLCSHYTLIVGHISGMLTGTCFSQKKAKEKLFNISFMKYQSTSAPNIVVEVHFGAMSLSRTHFLYNFVTN